MASPMSLSLTFEQIVRRIGLLNVKMPRKDAVRIASGKAMQNVCGVRRGKLPMSAQSSRAIGCWALFALFVLGCSGVQKPAVAPVTPAIRFHRQQDVGTAHVAIQSIAPFEDYVAALQPTFDKTTEQALTDVLAQTATSDAQVLRAFLATLKVALPTSSTSKTNTVTTKDGETTSQSTQTRQSGPGSLSDVPSPPAAVSNGLGQLALPDARLAVDESLRLKAAAALLQEVTLLNNYVRDAAVPTNRTPYIVRLLITLLPNARYEPYDVFTTVAFFSKSVSEGSALANAMIPQRFELGSPGAPPPHNFIDALPDITEETRKKMHIDRSMAETNQKAFEEYLNRRKAVDCNGQPLEVLPLLVTDNLESAYRSQSAENLLDLAASLQLMVHSIGASAGVQRQLDALQKSLNRDLNSIFTVARLNDNTIQARLGATYASDSYAIVPRTYNLTLLLLVPSETLPAQLDGGFVPCSYGTFLATTHMRDAETGQQLPAYLTRAEKHSFQRALTDLHIPEAKIASLTGDLLRDAEFGDFAAFVKRLNKGRQGQADTISESLWLTAVSIAAQSGHSVGTFQVPQHAHHMFAMPDGKHIAVPSLLDNGKDAATLTLTGGQNLLRDRLSATIMANIGNDAITLTATDVKVLADGRSATFTFPSLLALVSGDSKTPQTVRVLADYLPGVRNWQTKNDYGSWEADDVTVVKTTAPDPPQPGFSIRVPASQLRAKKDGTGYLNVEFSSTKPPNQMFFSVYGADIVTASDNVKFAGADRYVGSPGVITLQLRNMSTRGDVVVRAWRSGSDAENGGQSIFLEDVRVQVEETPDT